MQVLCPRFGKTEAGFFFPIHSAARTGSPKAADDEKGYQESQKHRHQRPHRLGQNHPHRTHPLLHAAHPRHARRQGQGRRRGLHGQHGAGARARHHHCFGRDLLRVEGPRDQHHRHAGARRFHHRGGTLAAGARRRDPGVVRGRRGPVPVDHRGPADAPLQGPLHRLCEQMRPLRRQPVARDRPAPRPTGAQRRGPPDPDRARIRVRGDRGSPAHEGPLFRRREG